MTTPANLPYWMSFGPNPALGAGAATALLVVAVGGVVGGSLLIVFARRRGRRELPSCPSCGHDLRGHAALPERCPECGDSVDPERVHGGRLGRMVGVRNTIRWSGRGLIVAGLVALAASLLVHPTRLRHTPTGWLLTVDLWWAARLLEIDHRPQRPARDAAATVFQEIQRRGAAGELTDVEVGEIARRFLELDAGGTPLEGFEQDLIGVALLTGGIPPAAVGAAEFMQHDVGTGRFNPIVMQPQLRLGGTGRIEIHQPICGWIKGMTLPTSLPDDLFELEIEVRSITVGGQPVDGRNLHRVRWPVTGSGRTFTVLPLEGTTFPEGPATIEWDAEVKVLGPETPTGSGDRPVLRSHVFPQRLPTEVDLVSPPPIVRSDEAGQALATALEADSVLEWDPTTGQGLLVIGTSTRSGLELGTPTVELLLESGGNVVRHSVPFVRHPLERPYEPGRPRDGGAATALHATVGDVTFEGESVFTIGDSVRVVFDSTDFDPTTWWDRLDRVAFARNGYGRQAPDVDWLDTWRDVVASLDRIVATRIEIDVPIVERSGSETP